MELRLIPGFDHNYLASDTGFIISKARNPEGVILKGCVNNMGYSMIRLKTADNRYTRKLAHRLIASAFLAPPQDENMEIDHKDGNPLNNSVSNLRWVTGIQNKVYGFKRAHKEYNAFPVKAIWPNGKSKVYDCRWYADKDFGFYKGRLRSLLKKPIPIINGVFFTKDLSRETYPTLEDFLLAGRWDMYIKRIPIDKTIIVQRKEHCRYSVKRMMAGICYAARNANYCASVARVSPSSDSFYLLLSKDGKKLRLRKHN